jgi:hypothetical protein
MDMTDPCLCRYTVTVHAAFKVSFFLYLAVNFGLSPSIATYHFSSISTLIFSITDEVFLLTGNPAG